MLSTLFTNLREHTIESKGVDFTEDLVPFESIQDLRNSESQLFFSSFQELLNFNDSADFAKKEGKAKSCKKGYPCGGSCIKAGYNCKKAVTGQARTYAEFLAQQNRQSKKSVQKPLNKSDKTKGTGNSKGTKKKQGETEMIKLSAVPTTEIDKLNRGTRLVAVKKISGIDQSEYDPDEIENLANSILQNKVQFPVIVQQESLRSFKVVAGNKMAAALQRAREIDPKAGEQATVFIAENDDEANAYKYQMQFLEEPSGKTPTPKAERRQLDSVNVTELGQEQLVALKRIKDDGKSYNPEVVENLAQSQLRVGNILPIIVKRDSLTAFSLESGGLALAAAQRAREIDPKAAEKTRVFVADDDNELQALKYQVGKERI